MEEQILKILRAFRGITPDADFTARSRSIVAGAPQRRTIARIGFFDSMKLGTAMVLASVLLFVLVGGFSYFQLTNTASVAASSFDFEMLNAEARKIDIRIQLGEATYFNDSTQQMAAALNDVSETTTDEEIGALLDEIVL